MKLADIKTCTDVSVLYEVVSMQEFLAWDREASNMPKGATAAKNKAMAARNRIREIEGIN